jgi:hypothetical protein
LSGQRSKAPGFAGGYLLENVDPFEEITWPLHPMEDQTFWAPLAERISNGPIASTEIDQIKRSLLSEKKTEDQVVVLRSFDEAERKLVAYLAALVAALKNSDSIDGTLKKVAMRAAFRGFFCIYQVGLIYAPLIAKHRYYVWNGVVFINRMDFGPDAAINPEMRVFGLTRRMARAACGMALRFVGSRKLGEVYAALANEDRATDFEWFINYACIIRSKPRSLEQIAEQMVERTDHKSFYMFSMIEITMSQLQEEVNTVRDRECLKRLIAIVRAKREQAKKHPSAKLVGRMLRGLEEASYFDKKRP